MHACLSKSKHLKCDQIRLTIDTIINVDLLSNFFGLFLIIMWTLMKHNHLTYSMGLSLLANNVEMKCS